MRKNKRTQKQSSAGITLVALVITIIILLILAGVSISMIVGENGIVTQARLASQEYEKAAKEEDLVLKQVEAEMLEYTEPWDGKVADSFANGNGTTTGNGNGAGDGVEIPFQISSAAEFAHLIDLINKGESYKDADGKTVYYSNLRYELTQSINLNGYEINPVGIGSDTESLAPGVWDNEGFAKAFNGTFNGNGNVITGINIDAPTITGVGIFGVIGETGVIENLNIYNGTIKGKSSVGSIAGVNSGTIRNCTNKANIIAQGNEDANSGNMAGGIVGWFEKGIIENCTNYGNVISTNDTIDQIKGTMAGGIIGAATSNYTEGTNYIKIQNCTNNGEIKSTSSYAGGISGILSTATKECTIENCTNNGKIIVGDQIAGGITGFLLYGTISNCTNKGQIESHASTATNQYGAACIGGIVGQAAYKNSQNTNPESDTGKVRIIVGSVNNGNILANTAMYAGGIVGDQGSSKSTVLTKIENCINSGEITATRYAGGISGRALKTSLIKSCSNSGTIKTGADAAGGIAGDQEYNSSIEKVSNTGTVISRTNAQATQRGIAGGIVGIQYEGTITEAYNSGEVKVENKISGKINTVGGIVGYQNAAGNPIAKVTKSYSKGKLGTVEAIGGIIGHKKPVGVVEKTYYYAIGNEKGIGSESTNDTSVTTVNDVSGKTDKVTNNIASYSEFLNWISTK